MVGGIREIVGMDGTAKDNKCVVVGEIVGGKALEIQNTENVIEVPV